MKLKNLKTHLSKTFEVRLTKHIFFNPWLFVVILFAFWGGYLSMFLLAYCVALLHELAHVFCARCLGVKVNCIVLYPFGITARLSSNYIKNSEKEFFIAFAGPLLNITLYWCAVYLAPHFLCKESIIFFADVNLAIAVLNLVPALPLDGGRMVKSMLVPKYGIIRSYNAMIKTSRILILGIGIVSLCVFFASKFNFSLVLISAFLFQNLGNEQISLSQITLNEIIENKHKLKAQAPLLTKTFCISEEAFASIILKYLSYDYFCIILVADKNAHIIKTLTETQILEQLSEHGLMLKFSDINDQG